MLKISYAVVPVYLNWFRRNSLLKCVSQPEIANLAPLLRYSDLLAKNRKFCSHPLI